MSAHASVNVPFLDFETFDSTYFGATVCRDLIIVCIKLKLIQGTLNNFKLMPLHDQHQKRDHQGEYWLFPYSYSKCL